MTLSGSKILVISKQSSFHHDIEEVLETLPLVLFYASDALIARKRIQDAAIQIIIADIDQRLIQTREDQNALPDTDIYDFLDELKDSDANQSLPFILIGSDEPDSRRLASYIETGPTIYLSRPINSITLVSHISNLSSIIKYKEDYQKLADESTVVKLELSRRNKQLAISSQVARQIISILNLNDLLHEIVKLIQIQFNYYYVSIWLISDDKMSVVLKVGSYNSGNAKGMLEPGFTLSVDKDTSIITHVCRTLTTYIAQQTENDPFYLPTDELPFTKAELAMPLLVKGQMLGVIDIESDRIQAFHPEDVDILTTLADQIAIAIRNAGLYNQVLRSREELEERILTRTKELSETNRQLELLEQNKTEFIQILSHELRTPLTLVSGYAELLLTNEAVDNDPFFRQPVLGVMTGAQRLHELIDSMVDMLKIDSRSLQLMPQTISMESILAPLIEVLDSALASRSLELTVTNIQYLPDIYGDLELLSKVFDQLITNAIKYTPDGGNITINGRHLAQDFSGTEEEFIEVSISDTGIGISPEHLEVIFTKFYSTGDASQHSSGKVKFKGGGPGLGLSIAKGIVEAHHGRIWAESPGYDEEKCPGSCFYVLLPLMQNL
jgi:signal transduction histidine kinase